MSITFGSGAYCCDLLMFKGCRNIIDTQRLPRLRWLRSFEIFPKIMATFAAVILQKAT